MPLLSASMFAASTTACAITPSSLRRSHRDLRERLVHGPPGDEVGEAAEVVAPADLVRRAQLRRMLPAAVHDLDAAALGRELGERERHLRLDVGAPRRRP